MSVLECLTVSLKCVLMSKTWSLLNISPLNAAVSRKFVSISDISVVNFISSLLVSHKENTSSIYLFHSSGFLLLLLIISVSNADIKMFFRAHCGSMCL